MILTDTHTHLYLPEFDNDRKAMLQRAFDKGVQRIFLPNIDNTSIPSLLQLEQEYPSHIHAMMGLHPCSVKENYKEELAIVKEWLDKRNFYAIGEIGIDLYWDKTTLPQQVEAFKMQCSWAIEKDIPIVIHSRDSFEEVYEVLLEMNAQCSVLSPQSLVPSPQLHGIFHCFSGTPDQAQRAIQLGFYLGIGGVVTYKKAGLAEVLKDLSLKHIVLETDAPYLTPVPYRGKRNESAYIYEIADFIANLKGLNIETVANMTTENSKKIFGI